MKKYQNTLKRKKGQKMSKSNKQSYRKSYKVNRETVKTINNEESSPFKNILESKAGYTITKVEQERIKRNHKELIAYLLAKVGYDSTIRYTKKEKRKFTNYIKNNLFEESQKRRVQPKYNAAQLNVREIPNKRIFKFGINKYTDDTHMREYADKYIFRPATTLNMAMKVAARIMFKYRYNPDYTSISIHDVNGNNDILFLSKSRINDILKAA